MAPAPRHRGAPARGGALALLCAALLLTSACPAPKPPPESPRGKATQRPEQAPEPAAAPNQDPQPFQQDELWGYRAADGTVLVEPRFFIAQPFSAGGIATAADREGWVVLDRSGKVLLRPYLFDNGPDPFKEGLARFVEGGKVGFFNQQGEVVIPATFDFAEPFADGKARVCSGCQKKADGEHFSYQGGQWWTIDKTGKKLEPPAE